MFMVEPGWRRRSADDDVGVAATVRRWASRGFALTVVTALPPLHILALGYFWRRYSRKVYRNTCSCSCWDTVFKGPYETGVASYKHLYFNATENTLKIWFLLVAFFISLYECLKWLVHLALCHRLRYEMAFLFTTSIFSHYYSWWAYVNYYNDEFYLQWYHQFFFTVTELISTWMVLHLADCKNVINIRKVLLICGIASLHIIAGGWDQFYTNVIRGHGQMHQIVRDVGFMLPDWMHVTVSMASLWCRAPRTLRLTRRLLLDLTVTTVLVANGFWLAMHL